MSVQNYIEDWLRKFVTSGQTNPNPDFKVGDTVKYYIHNVSYSDHEVEPQSSEQPVEAEVLKVNKNGTYDIKPLNIPNAKPETFEGKYLF